MSALPGKFVNRHVYTSAPANFPEEAGFRTVACATALRETGALRTIESLVESYSNREGGGAACRQFVPLTREAKAYALTVFTPLGFCPDGRTGNFWAETQVVPSEWLEQASWDAGAAFAVLSWLGPRDVADLHQDLVPEPLPPLEPRALDSLARLNELVPSDRLETLLQAVAQQSRGLRPLWLLEAQGDPPSALEEIVLLLPLVVPPTSRRYLDGKQHRCLTLRTRCLIGGMAPPTDITGYPAAAADNLSSTDGFLIDLAGRLPMPSFGDRFGRDYAQWLRGVIQESEWDKLAHLFKQAAKSTGPIFFAQYKSLLEASSRSRGKASSEVSERTTAAPEHAEESKSDDAAAPVSPPGAATDKAGILSPVQDRQWAWTARDQTEGALWNVLESHESQLKELVDKISKDFAAELGKTHAKLLEDVAGVRKGLEAKFQSIEKDIKNASKRSQQQSASPDKEPSAFKSRLAKLEREVAEIKKRMSELGVVPPEDPTVVPVITAQEKRFFRDMPALFRDWVLGHRWIAWGTGIGIVVAVLVAVWLPPSVQNSQESVPPIDGSARRDREDALVQRALPGSAAARLLENAANWKQDVAESAYLATLAIALSHNTVQIDGTLDCALLQAALRKQEPAISVDNDCGVGTIAALDAAPKGECCRNFSNEDAQSSKKRQSCFMIGHLELVSAEPEQPGEACLGVSPWREGRRWTEDEASRALVLFQAAAQAAKGAPDSELANNLRSLDPSQKVNLLSKSLAGEDLFPDEARRVLMLVWTAFGGSEDRLEQLTIEQLGELDRLVEQLNAENVPAGSTTTTASGAQ